MDQIDNDVHGVPRGQLNIYAKNVLEDYRACRTTANRPSQSCDCSLVERQHLCNVSVHHSWELSEPCTVQMSWRRMSKPSYFCQYKRLQSATHGTMTSRSICISVTKVYSDRFDGMPRWCGTDNKVESSFICITEMCEVRGARHPVGSWPKLPHVTSLPIGLEVESPSFSRREQDATFRLSTF